jgi:hypothetical protein
MEQDIPCGPFGKTAELFFFVASYIHDLATAVLATASASTVREVVFTAVRTLRQLGCRQILVAPAIAAAVPGHFALRYSSHEGYAPLVNSYSD